MSFDVTETLQNGVSRRAFMKGALLSGAALTFADKMVLAQEMANGRITSKDIRGIGVEPGLVRMALNENPIGPSRYALQAIADNMFDINRYGFNSSPLTQALAEYDGIELPDSGGMPSMAAMMRSAAASARSQGAGSRGQGGSQGAGSRGQGGSQGGGGAGGGRGGFRRRPTPFTLSAGSGQLLDVLALAYLSQGGESIEMDLGYGSISRGAEEYRRMGISANGIKVPATGDYKHDLDAMKAAITPATTLVVVTNPNNPTGTLMSYEDISAFVKSVPEDVVVVVDEAYIHFVRDPNYQKAIPLALEHENVIVIRTFSKVYGMPAMRLGYAVSKPGGRIQQKLRFYLTGSPNLLAQVAGAAAVKDMDHVRRSQEVVWNFRDRCFAEFDKMGLEYIPSESNFFMVNLGKDSMPVMRELFSRGVMVTNRTREAMPTWIRVSSGTERETEVFLNELKDIMAKTL